MFYGSVEGGNGVVVFVNSDEGNIILEVLNSVASVYNWKGFDKPVNINTKIISESLEKKYIGVYLYDGNIAEITKEKDGLYYWANDQTCKMYFTSDKDFINLEFPTEKSFITDGAGNIKGYARRVNGRELSSATKITRVDTIKANSGQSTSFGWHLLEAKKYDEAIVYLNWGIELTPDDITARNYLAHCYLFKNEYAKAVKLYKTNINKDGNDLSFVKAMIKQDLEFFKRKGFEKALIEKVFVELKL